MIGQHKFEQNCEEGGKKETLCKIKHIKNKNRTIAHPFLFSQYVNTFCCKTFGV